MLEAVLQKLILARVNALDGVRLWRANTGMAYSSGSGRMVRFGQPGQADLSGILRGGRRLEVEVKGPSGRVSDEQEAFGARITELGGLYIVARTLEDALNPIQAYLANA